VTGTLVLVSELVRSSEIRMGWDRQPDLDDRDEELLRAARNAPEGDLRAFEQLIALYQRRILADCFFLTRDDSNAEDLAQEVFVKAYFGLRAFEGRSSFRHWLQRIKVNHCLNHLKKQASRSEVPLDDAASEDFDALRVEPEVSRRLETVEDRARIEAILNSLPSKLRIPLIMRDMDDLSYEEVAASLNLGLSAVKMRVKRAREQFRILYGDPRQSRGEAAR
jgi:RNA polymerase sigma-70 factor, ECF subfamily